MDIDLGVTMEVKVHLFSEKAEARATTGFEFGAAKYPTRAEVDKAILDCIENANTTVGVDDFRLTHMGDFGFARTKSLEWEFGK